MNRKDRLYQQVAEQLRREILEEHYIDRLPTEQELVNRFQVSLTTIKKALSLLVQEGRVIRIPGKGTFPVDQHQPEMSPQRLSGLIAFLIPSLPDEFSRRLLKGAAERLNDASYSLVLGLTAPDPDREAQVITHMRELGVSGLIICPQERELYNEEILRLKLDRFPFVLLDRWLPGVDTPYVVSDGRRLVKAAVDHLVKLGHRSIALVATSLQPQLTQSLAERMEGFREACYENHVEQHDTWTINENMSSSELDAYELIRNRLQEDYTSVIATTTTDTVLVLRAAAELGLSIPADLSVVGFDYSGGFLHDVQGNIFPQGLTWIDQSEETMGRKAADILLDVIRDPSQSPKAVIPGTLHQGATTAPPRAHTRLHTIHTGAQG
ncbi:MAG: GntR family transcriptional regulator [Firmicutes bacterium]|nr:GntR family transcriptional regulator [Bacillota bacterium]